MMMIIKMVMANFELIYRLSHVLYYIGHKVPVIIAIGQFAASNLDLLIRQIFMSWLAHGDG